MEDAFPFLESATNLVEALRAQHPPEAIATWFAGRAIIGDVDLSGLAYPHRLALRGCMFWGRVTLEDAHFGNTLDLSDCQFDKGLNLDTARIEGNLTLERCKFGVLGPNRFGSSAIDALSMWQVEVRGAVLLRGARAIAQLNMRESRVAGRLTLNGIRIMSDLNLARAEIGASLYCESKSENEPRAVIGEDVWMVGAKVGGQADFSGAKITRNLNLESAEIGAGLFCRSLSKDQPRPEIGGRVWMAGAKVGGTADFCGVQITGDLDFQGAAIGADLYCSSQSEQEPRPEIGGRVRMSGTKVGSTADFSGAKITGDLDLQSAVIGADLLCRSLSEQEPRPEIGGRVWMAGAKVGSTADFSGAKITGDLDLQSAVIGADLLCRSLSEQEPRPEIGGRVRMSGTKVGGQADFRGAKITGDLDLQSAVIGADLLCRSLSEQEPRPEIGGRVWMSGTKVGSTADFSGAKITGDLDIQNTQIGADFDATSPLETNRRTEIGGTVSFTGSRVEGVTTFVGAEIKGSFSAVRAEFDDGLFLASATAKELRKWWRGERETAIAGGIDLTHARINARLALSGVNCGGAVNLHDTRVDGDVLAASTPKHPTRVAHVDASSLKVNGQFDFRTMRFACADPTRPCLDLSFAEINGNCFLPGGDGSNVRNLRLFHAKLGEAHFTLGANATVAADGFSFRQLNVPGNDYCRFLEATAPFQRSTYQTVERYLRERGDDRNADLVYREMMRRDRRQECPQRLMRLDHSLFGGNRQVSERDRVRVTRAEAPASTSPAEHVAPAEPQATRSWKARLRSGLLRCASTARRAALWDVSGVWKVIPVVLVYRAFGDFFDFGLLQCSLALLAVLVLWDSRYQALTWLWEVFLDVTTGRGTSSARMGGVLLTSFLMMWAMFLNADSVKREYRPTAAEVNEKADLLDLDKHPADAKKGWEPTEAAFAALRTVVPLMGDLPHTEWQPSSKNVKVFGAEAWFKYESAAGLVHALSYIALPLFLASLSGLLKKRGD